MTVLRVFFAVVVPALLALAVQFGIAALRRRPRFQRSPESSRIIRLIRRAAFLLLVIYIMIVAIGPGLVWNWFTSQVPIRHRDLSIAISGISITAWSGCLIAFAVKQRLTPNLSRGLRFILYSCFAPLVALVAGGAALRFCALLVALSAGFWTFLQANVRRHEPRTEIDLNSVPIKTRDGSEVGAPPSTDVTYLLLFVRDRISESLFGWKWSALLFVLAIVTFVGPSEATINACAVIALFAGMTLAFVALVVPDASSKKLSL
jgi:hypothetical protein